MSYPNLGVILPEDLTSLTASIPSFDDLRCGFWYGSSWGYDTVQKKCMPISQMCIQWPGQSTPDCHADSFDPPPTDYGGVGGFIQSVTASPMFIAIAAAGLLFLIHRSK